MSICARLPRPVPLRQIPPGRAGLQLPQDAVDDRAMISPLPATCASPRQQGLNDRPRPIGQLVSSCHLATLVSCVDATKVAHLWPFVRPTLAPSPEGISQRLQVERLTMPVAVDYARSRFLVSTAPADRERKTVGEAVGALGLALPAAKRLVRRFTTGHIGDGSGHRAGAIRRHQHRHIRYFSQLWHPFQQRSLCQLGLEGVS